MSKENSIQSLIQKSVKRQEPSWKNALSRNISGLEAEEQFQIDEKYDAQAAERTIVENSLGRLRYPEGKRCAVTNLASFDRLLEKATQQLKTLKNIDIHGSLDIHWTDIDEVKTLEEEFKVDGQTKHTSARVGFRVEVIYHDRNNHTQRVLASDHLFNADVIATANTNNPPPFWHWEVVGNQKRDFSLQEIRDFVIRLLENSQS